jgi:hypothetical protein
MWEEAAVESDIVLSTSLFVPPQRAQNFAFGTAEEEEGQPDVKALRREVTALETRNAALETLVLLSRFSLLSSLFSLLSSLFSLLSSLFSLLSSLSVFSCWCCVEERRCRSVGVLVVCGGGRGGMHRASMCVCVKMRAGLGHTHTHIHHLGGNIGERQGGGGERKGRVDRRSCARAHKARGVRGPERTVSIVTAAGAHFDFALPLRLC